MLFRFGGVIKVCCITLVCFLKSKASGKREDFRSAKPFGQSLNGFIVLKLLDFKLSS